MIRDILLLQPKYRAQRIERGITFILFASAYILRRNHCWKGYLSFYTILARRGQAPCMHAFTLLNIRRLIPPSLPQPHPHSPSSFLILLLLETCQSIFDIIVHLPHHILEIPRLALIDPLDDVLAQISVYVLERYQGVDDFIFIPALLYQLCYRRQRHPR